MYLFRRIMRGCHPASIFTAPINILFGMAMPIPTIPQLLVLLAQENNVIRMDAFLRN
jgi:hypothetical protein